MLWKCTSCAALYAVDMPRCPQCGATGHVDVDSGGEPVGPRFAQPEPEQDRPEQADPPRQEPATGPDPQSAAKTAAKPPAGKAAG